MSQPIKTIKNFKPLLGQFYLGIALTVLYLVLHHRGFLPEPSMWLNTQVLNLATRLYISRQGTARCSQ